MTADPPADTEVPGEAGTDAGTQGEAEDSGTDTVLFVVFGALEIIPVACLILLIVRKKRTAS